MVKYCPHEIALAPLAPRNYNGIVTFEPGKVVGLDR
jgi:hypothetical protein